LKITRTIGLLALLVIAIGFPLVFSNPAVTQIAVFTLVFMIAATGWNIFSGYTGYIALGHAAYFGIGAYALAIICQDWKIEGGFTPFLLMPLAGLVTAIFALPLGAIALRTRRHTFVVITVATFFILQLMAFNLRGLTNGSGGLSYPVPTWSGDIYNLPFYYVSLLLVLVALALSWWIRNSKYGLGLLAIRDDEDRALGLGVKTSVFKLSAFVISAFFVGMAGAMYGYLIGSIYPPFAFDALFDVAIALMVFMGGIGTLAGPILGTLILEPIKEYLALQFPENGWYLVIYGALFLIIIFFLPEGIVPSVRNYWLKRVTTRNTTKTDAGTAAQLKALSDSDSMLAEQGKK